MKIKNLIPDRIYISMQYFKHFKKLPNLKNPKTFNEKVNWLKLYNHKSEYTQMVDKYAVRDYIAEKLGEEYLIPLLGVWDDPYEIDFDKLPNQFVLKWNHDSGSVVVCKDKTKLNIAETVAMLASKKSHNGYWYSREWPYKDVKPRIIAEKYMEDSVTQELRDYKFFCFNGEMKLMFIASERHSETTETRFDFFDRQFQHLDFRNGHPNADVLPAKPEMFDEMCVLAEKLSGGIPLLRVDFYEVNGKIYFGELTFSHWGGMKPFEPVEWDYILGDWIELPEKNI